MRVLLVLSFFVLTPGCGLDCAIWGTFACGDGSKSEPSIEEIEPNDTEAAATDVGLEAVTIEGVCESDEEFDFFVRPKRGATRFTGTAAPTLIVPAKQIVAGSEKRGATRFTGTAAPTLLVPAKQIGAGST